MNQVKIGKFIAECRKNKNYTQQDIAVKLNITDRAVSKWENGKCLPDFSIMFDLCKILDITINDLLSGEIINKNDENTLLKQQVLEMFKEKQESDKRLLKIEIFLMIVSLVVFFGITAISIFIVEKDWLKIVLIISAFFILLTSSFVGIRIEQKAGYYVCEACGHKYIPSFKSTLFAMHIGRTRYLKCPKCGKTTWNKKVVEK